MASVATRPGFGTPDEIAKFLSLSVVTVRRLYSSGQLRATRFGRRIAIAYDDAEAFARSSVRQLTPRPGLVNSTLDGRGRAVDFAPAEARHRTRLALEALDALAESPREPDEPGQAESLAELEAALIRNRGEGVSGATW